MKFNDLLAMCARNLWRRKVRTFLTVFGVVIGTCSIIVMVSLGIGISESNMQWINQMGDLTIITVYPDWSSDSKDQIKLNADTIKQIKEVENVSVATPFCYVDSWSMPLVSDERYKYQGSIYGVDMDALEALGYEAADGRLFNGKDPENTAVFGSQAAYQFYDTKRKRNNYVSSEPDMNGRVKDPFVNVMKDDMIFYLMNNEENSGGAAIPKKQADGQKLKVVGVLDPGDSSNYQFDKNYAIYIDIDYALKLTAAYNKENGVKNTEKTYDQVYVKAADVDTVTQVEEDIKALGFQTSSMASMREELSKQMNTIQLVLGGIGGISMIVAALSITNTMVMSIYERTREIGVMKVLGCKLGNIRAMFLGEAGMIGLIGGAAGVLISFGISYLLNFVLSGAMSMGMGGSGNLSIIPAWLVLVGMAFATGVGLVAGVAPANRAVKISAIEAIRHE